MSLALFYFRNQSFKKVFKKHLEAARWLFLQLTLWVCTTTYMHVNMEGNGIF